MALAVGRRSHIYGGQLPTSIGVIYTAPSAPGDNSAAATVQFTVCNTSGSTLTVTIAKDNGSGIISYIYSTYSIPASESLIHAVNVDLMGGYRIQAVASASGAYIDINGIIISAS